MSYASGETLRTFRLGYSDRALGRETNINPIVIGPFPIAVANRYVDEAFARLQSMPVSGSNVERRWSIAMVDTNPTGDFPDHAKVEWPCVMLPWLPVEDANALAGEVMSRLKPQSGWGGSR